MLGVLAVLVAVVSRCTGAACWGRKDFFIVFLVEFGLVFFRGSRRGSFRLIPPSGGRVLASPLSRPFRVFRLTLTLTKSSYF